MPSSSANISKNCSSSSNNLRKKPFLFLSNLLRRKKVLEIDDIMFDREMNQRARSEPSVISYSCTSMGVQKKHSPSISTLTLTPGRCRDIDLDMQALRLSRQDNPFIQKVLASRESLVDTIEETVSDDAILMSQEFNAELDSDPFTLPEVQEHMIRSPPPTSWPRSPHFNIFSFPQENGLTVSSESSEGSCSSRKTAPQLREMFTSSPNHQYYTKGGLEIMSNTAAQQTAKRNGGNGTGIGTGNGNGNGNNSSSNSNATINLKENYSGQIPRPHSSHHNETPKGQLARPLSHYQDQGPLSVRNFK